MSDLANDLLVLSAKYPNMSHDVMIMLLKTAILSLEEKVKSEKEVKAALNKKLNTHTLNYN